MKRFVVWLCGALMIMAGVFTSCDKSEEFIQTSQSKTTETRAAEFRAGILDAPPVSDMNPDYQEKVTFSYSPFSQFPAVKLKLYYHGWTNNPNPEYVSMQWNSITKQYVCDKRILHFGRVSFRFVDASNVNRNLESASYEMRVHSDIVLNESGVTRLYWPFAWDGSTNSSRGRWSASRLTHESGASRETEYYSQDWNWGTGKQDLGRKICSPMTGVVSFVGKGPSTYGNMVDIERVVDGKTLRIRCAHLESILVKKGDFVGPNTYIGTIGNSGGNFSPHLHCAFNIVSPNRSLQFDFSK